MGEGKVWAPPLHLADEPQASPERDWRPRAALERLYRADLLINVYADPTSR